MLIQKIWFKSATLLAFAVTGSVAARADDTTPADGVKVESAVKAPDSAPAANGVDDLITNNNLRAYSGSKSRWSIASQFNYNGGTISAPLSQDRPDIANASATTTKADLDGSISAKYNLDTRSSLLAGIGVRWIAPLTPKGPSNYDGSTFDAMNPYVTYQFIYKWLGIQSVVQAQAMQWTQADQTALGYAQQFNVDQENMYEIGATRLSVGASVAVQYQTFNKSGSYGDPNGDNYVPVLAAVQSQYLFTIAPELEYQLSEKVNLRTLISLLTYEHYVSNSHLLSFDHDTVYQSIGVGIAVTRDIFLYPNIQFLPGQLQAAMTNVGLTATINLF